VAMTHRLVCLLTVTLSLLPCVGCQSPIPEPVHQRSGASTLLVNGSPAQAGFNASVLGDIDLLLNEGIRKGAFPGAVVCIVRHGVMAKMQAYGHAYLYVDGKGTLAGTPTSMNPDTMFDLASLSKLFTTVSIMKLVERGALNLDTPVARYIPQFSQNGKAKVTVRMLLTHTSGLQAGIPLWKDYQTVPQRLDAVYREKPVHSPGSTYLYSDLNFIVLGKLVERVSGQSLSSFVQSYITLPLGMKNTFYNPPKELQNRIAATEFQPWTSRGLLWGQVEDENAWALGGIAGHAGVFSDAKDLAIFAQMLLNGGTYQGQQILRPSTVQSIEQTQTFAGHEMALGFECNQPWYMGLLASQQTFGHTGFSGTSLIIDTKDDLACILLTNRVHPSRNGPSTNPYRVGVANDVANAIH
jgi:CubicO group peptidase (beta-lactamase class C family)